MTDRLQGANAAISKGVIVSLLFFLICNFCLAQANATGEGRNPNKESLNKEAKPSSNLVERGRYVVEGLSRCSQCHTPSDSNGQPDRAHWLEGAAVWLKPAEPVADWPLQAPRIAGTPPGTDAEMVKLLTTGIWRDGKPLRSPMPQFRMNTQDAEAVVAYLRSISNSE